MTRDRDGRMAKLQGDPTDDPKVISDAFEESLFFYQFVSNTHVSRVMRCSTPDELDFILSQVRRGSKIIMQRNSVCQPVYHYDPPLLQQLQPAH